ncbi:MAG: hypothetical protein OXI49_12305 [Acidobacteriota bacterium]|nr:hypothetical protein [Acidobacteriota bacterium]
MKLDRAISGSHRNGDLVVTEYDVDGVRTINQALADAFRSSKRFNPHATPPTLVSTGFTVHDLKSRSCHLVLVHAADHRPRHAPTIGRVVKFSKPEFAPHRASELQLGTPSYYRELEASNPGIGDRYDGTITKDASEWAKNTLPLGASAKAKITFTASEANWVFCASHYRHLSELRSLQDHFSQSYDYRAATQVLDPEAFAAWLGIDFALTFDKESIGKLDAFGIIGYAASRYETEFWEGAGNIDTFVHVYHGPVVYADRSGELRTQADWIDPHGSPKALFTKKTSFEPQREYRFAVSTPLRPTEHQLRMEISTELRRLTSPL